jgi:tetratricopeptide (TPR) repeat protein
MQGRGIRIAATTLMLAAASCGEEGKLEVRSTPSPFAAGQRAVPFRIAEANGQFALGNVALALEGYRKALREDPANLDALAGLAACYDQMGRFDLSRRYHEMALAVAPADTRLYANFAASLASQGRGDEAAALRAEMAQRIATSAKTNPSVAPILPIPSIAAAAAVDSPLAAQSEPPKTVAVVPRAAAPVVAQAVPAPLPAPAPLVAARSVTVVLPAPRPASPPEAVAARAGARLERLSLGEVALVTNAAPLWRAQLIDRSSRSARIGFRPIARQANVVLLNAARSRGLAGRTRSYLAMRGWSRIEIGDAPRVLGASTILYPTSRRATAVRLANQFGFALRHQRSESGSLTIMLGRDAAADSMLRATRG